MSLFEWFGESYNPGPVGSMEFGKKQKVSRTNGIVLLRLFISLFIITGIFYLVFADRVEFNIGNAARLSGIIFIYLVISYFIRPAPDTSNIGWFGGLIDHPFRYSDDINRFLLFFKIFLLPGAFISESLIEGVLLTLKK